MRPGDPTALPVALEEAGTRWQKTVQDDSPPRIGAGRPGQPATTPSPRASVATADCSPIDPLADARKKPRETPSPASPAPSKRSASSPMARPGESQTPILF